MHRVLLAALNKARVRERGKEAEQQALLGDAVGTVVGGAVGGVTGGVKGALGVLISRSANQRSKRKRHTLNRFGSSGCRVENKE